MSTDEKLPATVARIGNLFGDIRAILFQARQKAYSAVNFAMVAAYRRIGRRTWFFTITRSVVHCRLGVTTILASQ